VTEGFWESIALRLDASTRRSDGGRTLLGGSPLRLVRVSESGAAAVDDLVGGAPVGLSQARQRLARRLLDGGLAHPVPLATPDVRVGLVVPVRDHATELRELLDTLEQHGDLPPPTATVVVDDGSEEPDAVVAAVDGRAAIIRRSRNHGPAAARNAGWLAVDGDVVVFVDADVLPSRGWLSTVLAHFVDPTVAAVAPRVRGRRATDSVLDRYEEP
jgi:hypothetical protein